MFQVRIAAAVAFALVLVTAAPASAAPAWLPAAQSFGDTETESGTAVMAPDGTVVVGRRSAPDGRVQLRTRPPGGDFSAIQDLDAGSDPGLVAGPDSTIAAVWFNAGRIWASIRPPGGAFGSPREIVADNIAVSSNQIALDGSGRLWIVYQSNIGQNPLTAATLPPGEGGATIFPFFTKTGAQQPGAPSIGVAAGGAVHIVYDVRDETTGPSCTVTTEIRGLDATSSGLSPHVVLAGATATGTYVNPICFTSGGSILSSPRVAASFEDDVTAVFSSTAGAGGSGAVQARHRPPGSPWPDAASTPETVAPVDAAGLITYAGSTPVAGIQPGSGAASITARGGDGTWATPTPAGGADGGQSAVLAGSPGGAAVLASKENNGQHRFQAVVRSPDGTLSPPTPISGANEDGSDFGFAGVDNQGNAVVGYMRHTSTNVSADYRAEFAGYDGAGPRLDGLSVPATGSTGQSLAFSVAPLDVWSGVASTSWAFGDGATGDGASVSHAYSAAGDLGVSVTATDTLGNASSASKTVSVPAPPPPPSPKDTTKPVLSKVRVKPAKVKRGKKGTVSFSISEPAKLKAAVVRKARGVKKGRRCVSPPRKRRRGQKGCTRSIPSGSFGGAAAKAGAGRLTLPAKLRGHKLARGKYTVTLVATDAAGNRSKPARASFTVK